VAQRQQWQSWVVQGVPSPVAPGSDVSKRKTLLILSISVGILLTATCLGVTNFKYKTKHVYMTSVKNKSNHQLLVYLDHTEI